jgi:hypothetical protein
VNFSTNLYNNLLRQGSLTTTASSIERKNFARVLDVLLDNTHPDYDRFGKIESIYAIKYELVTSNTPGTPDGQVGIAYPLSITQNTIPLVDEIVEIIQAPSYSLQKGQYSTKVYYTGIVNVWNSTHHNALPNIETQRTSARLAEGATELDKLQILQPFPGDFLLQGRFGQSLRFTGFSHPLNKYTNQQNNADPLIIISNTRQKETSDPFETRIEDVNQDDSIIVIASNHTIPLQPVYTIGRTYKQDPTLVNNYQPTSVQSYTGNQITINSSRINLHAKEDSILLCGQKSVGLIGNSVNLEGGDYIGLDADKIYLGQKAKTEQARQKQPIVLGRELENWLSSLLNILRNISNEFKLATSPAQAALVLVKLGTSIPILVDTLSNELESIKSKKVFTE